MFKKNLVVFLVVNLRNISADQNLSELIYFSHSSNFISDNEGKAALEFDTTFENIEVA